MLLLAQEYTTRWGIFVDRDNSVAGVMTLLVCMGIAYYFIRQAQKGVPMPEIRKIPGLDSIDEAVGRATEMGKPVLFANRGQGLTSQDTYALWGYLSHVAKLCAQYDTRLIDVAGSYLVIAANEEIIRQAYLEAGRPDAFNKEDIRYIPSAQWAWTAATIGLVRRERPAAILWIGYFYGESILLGEGGSQVGAIQIAATRNNAQIPFFLATCDYVLIGEEQFAASAYLTKNPVLTASIVMEDWGKVIIVALILLGTLVQIVSPDKNFVRDWLYF